MVTTTNKLLALPSVGGESGTWGTNLNANTVTPLDLMLGGTASISLSATDYTLTASDIQNLMVKLSGTLLSNVNVFSSCVGFFAIENNCTGNFTITFRATSAPTAGTPFGASFVIPQGVRTWFVSDAAVGLRPCPTWLAQILFAASGAIPLSVRRMENDTTIRKAISVQSGLGSGNDYSISETGDGSSNVVTVTEQIGATVIGTKTVSARGFPIPADFTEITTPAAPAAGTLRAYAKSGDALAVQGSNGVERIIGLALPGAHFLTIKNNAGTPNSQADITISGQVICTNSSGFAVQFSNPGATTCNLLTVGVNGLDTGSLAAAIQPVYFYGVSNGTLFKILASLTAPTAGGPSLANAAGYTFNCYLGAMLTDATPNLFRTSQAGARTTYNGTLRAIPTNNAGIVSNVSTYFPPNCMSYLVNLVTSNNATSFITDGVNQVAVGGQITGAGGMTQLVHLGNVATTFTVSERNSASSTAYGWVDRVNAT